MEQVTPVVLQVPLVPDRDVTDGACPFNGPVALHDSDQSMIDKATANVYIA